LLHLFQYSTNTPLKTTIMSTDLKKLIGERLKGLRKERNLTQEQMSEMLNLSTSAYCKMEYGQTDLTLTRLNQIAEIFNMSAIELFSKMEGGNNFEIIGTGSVGATYGNSTTINNNVENCGSEVMELIKANNKIIDLLSKRIDELEKKIIELNKKSESGM